MNTHAAVSTPARRHSDTPWRLPHRQRSGVVIAGLSAAVVIAGLIPATSGFAERGGRTVRIDVGGTQESTTRTGNVWRPDNGYQDGERIDATGGKAHAPRRGVLLTSRAAKALDFHVPVHNGTYQVRLIMMETAALRNGDRVFSATAEGVPVFANLDLAAVAGPMVEVRRAVVVRVTDSTVDIHLSASSGAATVSGIVIVPSSRPVGTRIAAAPTPGQRCTRAMIKAGALASASPAAAACARKWQRASNGGWDGSDNSSKPDRSVAPRPSQSPPSATEGTPTSGLVKGVNDHPIWLREPAQNTSLDLLTKAGVQAVRLDVPWDVIEPTEGAYDSFRLGLLDHYIAGLHARGIDPLLIVLRAPSWANGSSDPKVPPRNDRDYADFLAFLIKHYAGEVSEYEIWNEPNGGWAWTNPDPARYTQLLKAAYTRAKEVDPSITILGASLSGPDFASYLQGMYAAGAAKYFDVLSMHGYGDIDRGAYPGASYPLDPARIFAEFQQKILPVMQRNGDGSKPIWWTETGMTTATGTNSEQTQATFLTKTFQAASTYPQIKRLYWYAWMNSGTDKSNTEHEYGVINEPLITKTPPYYPTAPWSLKPAFAALRDIGR